MIKEFKEFINQGSVLDTAIGLVMALAFKAIIDSVVDGLIMPIVGFLTSGYDLNSLKIVLFPAEGAREEVALYIGTVIQAAISFIIIALVLFLIVKAFNTAKKLKKEEPAEALEAPAEDVQLLTEIRDLLAAQKTAKSE